MSLGARGGVAAAPINTQKRTKFMSRPENRATDESNGPDRRRGASRPESSVREMRTG